MVGRMDIDIKPLMDPDTEICPVLQEVPINSNLNPTQEQNPAMSPPMSPAKPKLEPIETDIKKSLPEGYNYSHFENYSENNVKIFEITQMQSLKKMARQHKDTVVKRAMRKAIYIREKEIPMPIYDPDLEDRFPSESIIAQKMGHNPETASCPKSPCAMGCVCSSINCCDMYEENYEKHCRDTGDPDCIYGCVCNKNGESKWPNSLPFKYKRQKFRDDEECGFVPAHLRDSMRDGRPKRNCQPPTRFRPDFHTTSNSNTADGLLSNGNGYYGSNGNGFSRRSSRQRRLLDFESMDVDYGEDVDEDSENSEKGQVASPEDTDFKSSDFTKKSAAAKLGWKKRRLMARERAEQNDGRLITRSNSAESGTKKRKYKHVLRDSEDEDANETTTSSVDDVPEIPIVPRTKRKYTKRKPGGRGGINTGGRMATRRTRNASPVSTSSPGKQRKVSNSGSNDDGSRMIKPKYERLREPSKRERKPRNLDLPEPEPRRPRRPRGINGHCHSDVPVLTQRKQESKKFGAKSKREHIDSEKSSLSQGIPLHVIPNQPASKSCRGMYTILRGREIVSFVTWDTGENAMPFLEEADFNYTQAPGSGFPKPFSVDILQLPYVKSEDTYWIFYFLKSHYTDSQYAIFPELHSLVSTAELDQRMKGDSIEGNVGGSEKTSAQNSSSSRLIDISDLNVNVPEDPSARGQNLFAFIGKSVDSTIIFGCPPQIFREKLHISANLANFPNILFRGKTQGMRRKRVRLSIAAQTPVLPPPSPKIQKNESSVSESFQVSPAPPASLPTQERLNGEDDVEKLAADLTTSVPSPTTADLKCNSPMPPSTPPADGGVEIEPEISAPPPLPNIVQLPQEIETI